MILVMQTKNLSRWYYFCILNHSHSPLEILQILQHSGITDQEARTHCRPTHEDMLIHLADRIYDSPVIPSEQVMSWTLDNSHMEISRLYISGI